MYLALQPVWDPQLMNCYMCSSLSFIKNTLPDYWCDFKTYKILNTLRLFITTLLSFLARL